MTRYVAADVTSAFDAAGINDNFQRIQASIAQLLSLVGDIPNSMEANLDMNGYAILNQLNPLTLEAFHWLGPWVTSTAYSLDDAVFFNSSSYVCIVAHTSGVFGADLAADKWQIISQGTTDRSTWTGPNTYYFIGDIITDGSDLYRCLVDNLSTASFANDLAAGWWALYTNFLGSMALQNANAVAITGGSVTGTTLGSAAATLTGGSASGMAFTGNTITGGSINNTNIGATTPASGTFTNAFDSGSAPVTSAQLTNKAYVDGTFVNAASGYVRLPMGVIKQWGSGVTNGAGTVTVTFPIPFTTTLFSFQSTLDSAAVNLQAVLKASFTGGSLTNIGVLICDAVGAPLACGFNWFAIGS